MKEWNWGGTKLSEGQIFTLQDQQDCCLKTEARQENPADQEKGKVGQRKVLFLQNSTFSHRLP